MSSPRFPSEIWLNFYHFLYSFKLTGAPLTGAGRIQFNFDLEPIKEIEVMANLPQMVFPLFWVEEGADIPDEIIKMIKYGIYL